MLSIQPNSLEEIHTRTFDRGIRVLGFTASSKKNGASDIAAKIAKYSADQGKRTLFVSDRQTTLKAMNQNQKSTLKFNPIAFFAKNSVKMQQKILSQAFNSYERIVMDLGTSAQPHDHTMLKACEAVFLACHPSHDSQSTIEKAVADLTKQEARLAGLVTNQDKPPSMAQQMLREFSEINWMLPKGLQQFIKNKTDAL